METFSNFSVFYSGVHNYEDRARAEAPDDSDINGDDDGDGDGNGDRLGTVVLAWSVTTSVLETNSNCSIIAITSRLSDCVSA